MVALCEADEIATFYGSFLRILKSRSIVFRDCVSQQHRSTCLVPCEALHGGFQGVSLWHQPYDSLCEPGPKVEIRIQMNPGVGSRNSFTVATRWLLYVALCCAIRQNLFLWILAVPIGSMVLVYMLTWLGYIDGIHGTPYIAAPWILCGQRRKCHATPRLNPGPRKCCNQSNTWWHSDISRKAMTNHDKPLILITYYIVTSYYIIYYDHITPKSVTYLWKAQLPVNWSQVMCASSVPICLADMFQFHGQKGEKLDDLRLNDVSVSWFLVLKLKKTTVMNGTIWNKVFLKVFLTVFLTFLRSRCTLSSLGMGNKWNSPAFSLGELALPTLVMRKRSLRWVARYISSIVLIACVFFGAPCGLCTLYSFTNPYRFFLVILFNRGFRLEGLSSIFQIAGWEVVCLSPLWSTVDWKIIWHLTSLHTVTSSKHCLCLKWRGGCPRTIPTNVSDILGPRWHGWGGLGVVMVQERCGRHDLRWYFLDVER